MAFMISDNTTNASGCNPISGSSSTMVAGRKSLGCANLEVYIKLHNMKGNISIDRVSGKLNRLIHNFDFVTTLYDFYGFKRLSDNETKKTLEDKIKNGIKQGQQRKIIPYVQMYEFEALLFSDQ
jgi:hypothetical protein